MTDQTQAFAVGVCIKPGDLNQEFGELTVAWQTSHVKELMMSFRKERQKVLELLEKGRIGPEEAEGLLSSMGSGSGERVVLEMDADRENLKQVVRILSKAFGQR